MRTTAVCFDPDHVGHDLARHPENARRLSAVGPLLEDQADDPHLLVVPSPEADWSDLERVHTTNYLSHLRSIGISHTIRLDSDTYFTPDSLDVARRSVGGALACTDAVFEDRASNAFALVRPPGHHATPDRAMGFCLLNTIAVTARYARNRHGAKRVAIVDFDVHHGNGTQDVFYEDGDVLFMSVHQSPLYPGTGNLSERGAGEGLGKTLNAPIPSGCGDDVYAALFDRLFEPRLTRFAPDLILVSAGFDAHWRDPLASTHLSVTGFAELVTRLLAWADDLCDGRLVLILEGGYDPSALTACITACLRRLHRPDASIDDPIGASPAPGLDVELVLAPFTAAF